MRPSLPAASTGFTLIEVLIALTLFSLIMLSTVTGFRTLARTQLATEEVSLRNDEVRAVSTFLRDAFESAVLGSTRGSTSLGGSPRQRTVFELDENSMQWRTGLQFGESAGGAYIVRVSREGGDLTLRWQQMDGFGRLRPWGDVPARTLVEEIQELSIAYRPAYGDPWLTQPPIASAPAWVRLRIKKADRYWPDLVMEVAR
jgi:general secretion pathway protein J